MTIVLLGYMGSGKSSIGDELSSRLNYDFIDFDQFISQKEGLSIPEIFELKGEIHFRKLETNYLKEVLSSTNRVIALGGGTPCYSDNMQQILSSSKVRSVYLKTTIPTLANRLFPQRSKRPLLSHINTIEELQEFVGKHLFERNTYYLKAAASVQTDDKTVTSISQEIIDKLF